MIKIKKYFYIAYLLFFVFCAFIGVFYEDMVLHWDWDPVTTWTGLIRLVLKTGGIGILMLAIVLIVENIHLAEKNKKIKNLENEITDLKAKLYDLSQDDKGADKLDDSINTQQQKEEKPKS